jgi:hypothetical protein
MRYKKHMKRLSIIAVFFFAFCFYTPQAESQSMPFRSGEKLSYTLYWERVPAGKVVLETLPDTVVEGKLSRHFRMKIRSSSFVDVFYKVRSEINSFTDPIVRRSHRYTKKTQEGSYKRDFVVDFHYDNATARYVEKTRGPEDPVPIEADTLDPLSIFYGFRMLDLEGLETVTYHVSDGKKTVLGSVEILGKESIEVPAGSFETIKLRPDLKHLGGVFKKSKDAELHIWVTNDARRMPVRMSSAVKVGKVHVLLKKASF